MSKSNAFETDLLELLFNGTTIANIADDTVTAPATTLTIALHTADPGEAGDQTTNEITTGEYNGYLRVAVTRSGGGWAIAGNSVSPVADITFATSTGGTGATVSYFSVGTGTAEYMLYSGTVSPNIVVSASVTPVLTTSTAITED